MSRYRSSFNHSEEQKRNLKVDLRRIPEWEEELESIRNHFRRFDLKQVRSAGWLINRMCKDLHLYGTRSMYHREYERKIERWKYSLPIDDLCSFAQSFVGFGKEIKKSIQSYLRHTENRLAGFREKGLTNSFWVSLFTSKVDAETLRREEQTKAEYLALSQEIPEVEKAVKLLEEVTAETCGYSSRILQIKERLSIAVEKKEAIERFEAKHGKALAKAASVDKKARGRATSLKRLVKKTKECPYCGADLGPNPHLDHIYPISKGGLSIVENVVWCCSSCNEVKMDKGLVQFLKGRGVPIEQALSKLHSLGKHV